MSLSVDLLDGSNTTTAPCADASAANARVPRDRRSIKNTDAPTIAGLTLSTAIDRDCLGTAEAIYHNAGTTKRTDDRSGHLVCDGFPERSWAYVWSEHSWTNRCGLPSASCPCALARTPRRHSFAQSGKNPIQGTREWIVRCRTSPPPNHGRVTPDQDRRPDRGLSVLSPKTLGRITVVIAKDSLPPAVQVEAADRPHLLAITWMRPGDSIVFGTDSSSS